MRERSNWRLCFDSKGPVWSGLGLGLEIGLRLGLGVGFGLR
jgi:hypothetical protein